MFRQSKGLYSIEPLSSVYAHVSRQDARVGFSLILAAFEERRVVNSHAFVMHISLH
jgi:hypothetical protein